MGETSEVVHTEESLGHCSNASYGNKIQLEQTSHH